MLHPIWVKLRSNWRCSLNGVRVVLKNQRIRLLWTKYFSGLVIQVLPGSTGQIQTCTCPITGSFALLFLFARLYSTSLTHYKAKVRLRWSRRCVSALIGLLRGCARRVKARFVSWSDLLWLGPGKRSVTTDTMARFTVPNSMRTFGGNLRETPKTPPIGPFCAPVC